MTGVTSSNLAERINDRAEAEQTLIDVSSLLQPKALSVGLFLSLRSRQIYKIESRFSNVVDSVDECHGLYSKCQDCMRATGFAVHGGSTDVSVSGALFKQL